jgi:outer membrane protein OmpA-like peptidoglycan-associated protein
MKYLSLKKKKMIKQTWVVSDDEKRRIISLHENATKRQYLIKEQESGDKFSEKSWKLCTLTIFQSGDKYFAKFTGETIEIPKLSEVSGTIQGGELVLSQLTQNGLTVGAKMNSIIECSNKYPQAYKSDQSVENYRWFCYFDDVSSRFIGDRGQEKYVKNNIPIYGILSDDGSLMTGQGDFIGEKIPREKNGLKIQYGVSRSRRYMFEVSPAMPGQPIVEKEEPITPITPQSKPIELDIESPFVFDRTILTPDAQQRFNQFVEDIKKNYQGVSGNVDVLTSASIDADPAKKEEYNMNLSVRRANAIIELLKSSLGETSLTFIPKPIGQTDQFAPGMKWPEVQDNDKTAPNRRLIIKLPKITK